MTDLETELLTILRKLDETARTSPAPGPRPDLPVALARIADLTRRLPAGTPPELLHFLHKRSLEKARLFLEGRDPEPGACPH